MLSNSQPPPNHTAGVAAPAASPHSPSLTRDTSPLPPRIFVTADDFGIGYETSRGIVDCHLAGAVDATSVMTSTGDHLERSMPLLERAPNLQLGLHITLTSLAGRALVATKASGLLNKAGNFHSLPGLYLRAALGQINHQAVRDEIAAQLDRFVRVVGKPPSHVDGHHHSHQLPIIREVVADLIRDGVLPNQVRNTPPAKYSRSVKGAAFRRAIIEHLGRKSRPVFAAVEARMPDAFFGVLSDTMLADENPWGQYLAGLDPSRAGRYELGVHPGYDDPPLAGRDTYLSERVVELKALLRVGEAVKKIKN